MELLGIVDGSAHLHALWRLHEQLPDLVQYALLDVRVALRDVSGDGLRGTLHRRERPVRGRYASQRRRQGRGCARGSQANPSAMPW